MQKLLRCSCWTMAALLATLATAGPCQAEERTANKVVISDPAAVHPLPAPRKVHPLDPVLQYAREGYAHMKNDIRDYSCVLIKRERVGGKLGSYQHLEGKIRHELRDSGKTTQPFSVYLKFLAPAKLKDREVLFVQGEKRRRSDRAPRRTATIDAHDAARAARAIGDGGPALPCHRNWNSYTRRADWSK